MTSDLSPSERQAFALLGPLPTDIEYSLSGSDLVELQKSITRSHPAGELLYFPTDEFEEMISRLFWPLDPSFAGDPE
jgi:hypothetical protein